MDKKEILKRMKMFSERTIENGCSEAEAMLAAKKLSELQAKYNVTLTELDVQEMDFEIHYFEAGRRKHPVVCALGGIGEFCQVEILLHSYSRRSETTSGNVSFFGEPHNVQNALYLMNLIKATMEQEFAQFKTQWEYQDLRMRHHPQSIRSNFLNAMGYRISSRLRKMASEERKEVKEQASTGTDLIVLAGEKRNLEHRKMFPRIGSARGRNAGSGSAAQAGAAAGDRASLSRGVGSSSGGTLRLS